MWNDDNLSEEELNTQIADFADSVMSGSALDMNCDSCAEYNEDCENWIEGKKLVEQYQIYRLKDVGHQVPRTSIDLGLPDTWDSQRPGTVRDLRSLGPRDL